MSFRAFSRELAEQFLQTAVLVDDRAFKDSPEQRVKGGLRRPGRRPSGDLKDLDAVPATEPEPAASEDEAHEFDSKGMVNAFAERSIFCSLIPFPAEAGKEHVMIERTLKLARQADIVVLDWVLVPGGRGEGQEAIKILREILATSSMGADRRVRLILIYTGSPDLADILKTVRDGLHKEAIETQSGECRFSLQYKGARIGIYAKPDAQIPEEDQELRDRMCSPIDLVDRIIDDFAGLTAGLVSNVALKSLTVLRENTHRLMGTLHGDLDAALLAHRCMLTRPEDAEDMLVDLVASEFRTLLEDYDVGAIANMDRTHQWLDEKHKSRNRNFEELFDGLDFNLRELAGLLEQGVHQKDLSQFGRGKAKFKKMFKRGKLTKAFHVTGPDALMEAQSIDRDFAFLTLFRGRYKERSPYLTLGVILQTVGSEEYWLCLQPRCDSVRLSAERAFPFLPLEKSSDSIEFALKTGNGDQLDLTMKAAPHKMRMVTFVPRNREDRIWFHGAPLKIETADAQRTYLYLAELKSLQAQRVANRIAQGFFRIGLDESEWLRLSRRH